MTLEDRTSLQARLADSDQPRSDWRRRYAGYLAVTDFVIIIAAIFGTQWFWLGTQPVSVRGIGVLDYTGLSLVLVIAWMLVLELYDTRTPRLVGYGSGEYRAIVTGALRLFGVVAIISYLLGAEISRGYILISFPLGVVALALGRAAWRRWLVGQRRQAKMVSHVLMVGDTTANLRILAELERQPQAGYVVVGACSVSEAGKGTLGPTNVPVLGGINDVSSALEATGADTVLVSSESGLSAQRVRELSWELESGQQHLIMAVNLTDIGGPRIHMRPVAGLPLMHVETPKYTGPQVFAKRAFDILGSGLLILLLSPVLITIAIIVKVTSRGPVLYGQERIGINAVPFHMLKFRSMVVGADERLKELLEQQGRADSPLFKLQDDPRITPIGKVLRKYSLDELPQLFNVFLGSMSLVGPRPQRDGEVALYDEAAKRRLIVKPGMSGLWQVSGRSALSWEDAIRLDLYYVENWSLTGDIGILFRTFKAVFAPGETAH